MTRQWIQAGWGLLLLVMVAGCESSGTKDEPRDDAGPAVEDAGSGEDAGPGTDDGGSDAGVEPLACEKQQGVCAGARRAWVDGAYEPECTARSYGADYEAAETRCDGLDNDCDGVTDPPSWSRVTSLETAYGRFSSLKTDSGVFVSIGDGNRVLILRLSSELSIQGTASVSMPWIRTGATEGSLLTAKLLRMGDRLALHYSTTSRSSDAPLRAYLVPLDNQGAPIPEPEEGLVEHLLFDRPLERGGTQVAASSMGDRLLVTWNSGTERSPPRQVMGMVTDAQGQVVTAPKVLFSSATDSVPYSSNALWLRNGEVLAVIRDEKSHGFSFTVRLRRFDANLDPVDGERSFDTTNEPIPRLVDLGATRGGPLESPVLVMRASSAPDWINKLQVVQNLFNGGQPETWAEAPTNEILWYSALADEGVLRLGWLSVFKDHQAPPPGGDDWLGWNGRLWTLDEGQAAVDRSPDSEALPLHRYAQWVLLEKLEPRRMGALYMTTTPDGSSLDAVRYCTP
ncbi:putative metal-binding motif-containing protein [Myxococcus qinghaiensis]|uniref:putative metal-binding motif-containing protein n=1 Tax=Myxococcus qinghaiensis TaxID=2906758 RepID=UPI0020A747E7|nr:putative metal-binding motif-containing protein [Myxococcus qinghaiensis]MCP3169571.1 putative metal-binding motif-containing protein [Myxococcus qinghaiensis]